MALQAYILRESTPVTLVTRTLTLTLMLTAQASMERERKQLHDRQEREVRELLEAAGREGAAREAAARESARKAVREARDGSSSVVQGMLRGHHARRKVNRARRGHEVIQG